ncbi:hypothetical protein H9M94_01560 [Mycoplasma sp. Pen4]|uniref:hypothetical protein n=1 Tax=Mycoplasma sp. Pen4 TaxID=640330 RepID=UPI001654959F|nr:hypothetical protein [Mycoplasma sp. Pen4]QNM93941.1 hypothetical protein H9M94_01560 [Mycoplasma sp. Pen4]
MTIQEIKTIFIDTLSATTGIVKLENPVLDIDIDKVSKDNEEKPLEDYISVTEMNGGYSFVIAVTLLEGVSAKFISSQLFKQLSLVLRKKKIKLINLTIIFKGVTK